MSCESGRNGRKLRPCGRDTASCTAIGSNTRKTIGLRWDRTNTAAVADSDRNRTNRRIAATGTTRELRGFKSIVVNRNLAWSGIAARNIIDEMKGQPGALLPILHALQETFGYIDSEADALIADALNVSRAEVHGVVSFYHDFRRTPPASHTLKICRAEACQSVGGERLAAQAEARLGVKFGEATADGHVSLEPVYCLGLCSAAPSAMLDGRIIARLDDAKLDRLLAEVK